MFGTSPAPHFVGCEVDVECFARGMEALVKTNTGQFLDEKSDILGTAEVVDAGKIVLRVLRRLRARKRIR